jgi:hypothetical protein
MRVSLPLLVVLAGVLAVGRAPAAVSPPHLLGLSVSNGGKPFAGDSRELATVSPNGDGLRDQALIRFRLDRPATVDVQAVATDEARRPVKVVWEEKKALPAGPHTLHWQPHRNLQPRTYLLRFVVTGQKGSQRVYGFEPPRKNRLTSGLVVRILGVEVSFLRPSYPQGAQAAVSIATDAPAIRIQFLSYRSPGSPATRDGYTYAVSQTSSVRLDWRGNRNAPHTLRALIPTSPTWPSGVYFMRVTTSDGRVGYAPLVVRSSSPGANRVAVIVPTNTWQAYNFRDSSGDGWGDSWYIGGASPTIDLRRPYVDPGLPYRYRDWNASLFAWLRQSGKQADYLSDDDLSAVATGEALRNAYDLVVFAGHEEYVTSHVYDIVERYRDLGGNLMFLSANNFFWKVNRQGHRLRRIGLWRRLSRPEAALIGVQYTASNYGGNEKPYTVQGALTAPWAFAGTGLDDGSTFGHFGIEVDRRAAASPANTIVLARISHAIGNHDAEMTFYRAPSGAEVFAAGALDFPDSIGLPAVAQLVDNVWSRLSS